MTDTDWEPGEPKRHIDETITTHRENGYRGTKVADNIENTLDLPYVPDFLREHVATSIHGLGYTTDDYISISKVNFEDRVTPEKRVIVTFGSMRKRRQQQLSAEATVVKVGDSKQDDMVVEIDGKEVDIKGWQISGVLKPDAKERAIKRHLEEEV